MSGLTTTQNFTDTTLPIVSTAATIMLNDANLQSWFQADGSAINFGTSPAIATFVDKKGSPRAFVQSTTGAQAALTANLIGGFPAAVMNGTDYYLVSGVGGSTDFAISSTFTLVWFGEITATTSSSQMLFSKLGTNGLVLEISPAGLVTFIMAGASVTAPYTPGQPLLVIATYNFPLQLCKLRVNGVNAVTAAATATQSGGQSAIGGTSSGALLMTGTFDELQFRTDDLFLNASAFANLQSYFQGVYALTAA